MSANQVWTGVAVAATVGLYCASAGLMFVGHWLPAIFIAEVACGVSAYAAVRAVKCYAARLCRKIDDIALERDVARLTGVPGQRVR